MSQSAPPDVSVVIPCFNHGAFVEEAVASVEACRGVRWDLVTVDDGSDEPRTLEVLGGLRSRGHRVVRQANQGLSAARNAGIALTRGRHVLCLDSDNRVRPDFLRLATSVLDQAPAVGVVYGHQQRFGLYTELVEMPEFSLQRLLAANFIDAGSVFRRAVWEECGGFDTEMPDRLGYEDWEFWLRAARRGWQFLRLDEVVMDYRVRADSMLQKCAIPENHERLVRYIVTKHRDLYASYLPEVVAGREGALYREIRVGVRLREELAETGGRLAALREELEREWSERVTAATQRAGAAEAARAAMEEALEAARETLGRCQADGAAGQAALAAARAELGRAAAEVARLDAELVEARRVSAFFEQQRNHLAGRAAELQDTLLRMRDSWFWRARSVYVRLRGRIQGHWS